LEIASVASSEEHVGLVEKHHAAPTVGKAKMMFKSFLDFFCALADLAC
jgi:hypothetical protein